MCDLHKGDLVYTSQNFNASTEKCRRDTKSTQANVDLEGESLAGLERTKWPGDQIVIDRAAMLRRCMFIIEKKIL